MSDHSHSKLPKPAGRVVKFADIDTVDEAFDYMYAGYHACVDRIAKTHGAEQRLWDDAADAYFAASSAMLVIKSLPAAAAVTEARKLLSNANHKADIAAATHKS